MIIALLCTVAAGCEKGPSEKMKDQAEGAKEQVKESAHNVWSGTVKALDKAKAVGKTVMDSADEERRKIDRESE
jgi:hypothetical protein